MYRPIVIAQKNIIRNLSKEKSKERNYSNDKMKYGSNFSTLGYVKHLSSNSKSK